jgi:hypothetical protein
MLQYLTVWQEEQIQSESGMVGSTTSRIPPFQTNTFQFLISAALKKLSRPEGKRFLLA